MMVSETTDLISRDALVKREDGRRCAMSDLTMTIVDAQKQLQDAWIMLHGHIEEKISPYIGAQKVVEEGIAGKPVAGYVVLADDHDRKTFDEMREAMQKRAEQSCKLLGVSTDRIEIIRKIVPYEDEDEDGVLRWACTIGWKLKLTRKERKRLKIEEKEAVIRALKTLDALYKKLEVEKHEISGERPDGADV